MVNEEKSQPKSRYEYIIQMKDASGVWFDGSGICKNDSFFPIWKEYFGDAVRLIRRPITGGEWEVCND